MRKKFLIYSIYKNKDRAIKRLVTQLKSCRSPRVPATFTDRFGPGGVFTDGITDSINGGASLVAESTYFTSDVALSNPFGNRQLRPR